MKVDGKPYRTIWPGADGTTVQVIDQTLLPHAFVVRDLTTMEDAEHAIRSMIVRGAPLIGATAGYGMPGHGLSTMRWPPSLGPAGVPSRRTILAEMPGSM